MKRQRNPNYLLKKMTSKKRKSKKVKFGFFKTEKLALERLEHKKKYLPLPKGHTGKYFAIKVKRPKEGRNTWLAYCLHRKETGR